MSNGFPMAAIVGTSKVMDAAQTSFISSTYWTGRVGPAASITTINKFQKHNVPKYIDSIGQMIGDGWKKLAEENGIDIEIETPNALITFVLKYKNAQAIRTLFTQEMLKKGYLATPSVYVSFSHTKEHVEKYLKDVDSVFKLINKAIENNNVEKQLNGPIAHTGFKRLT